MELRGPLANLRRDDIEWARGQHALTRTLSAWRAEPIVAPVLAAMKRFGSGLPLERCPALALLFEPANGRADTFVYSLVAAGLAALDGHPLGQLPLRHGSHDAAPMLVLAQAGSATLALAAYDAAALTALPAPRTARFRPCETWERVLAGSGKADRVLRDEDAPGGLRRDRLALAAGDVHYCYRPREALQVRRVVSTMAVLRLERRLEAHEPVREFALADGALVHQASAHKEDSRGELVLALLGRMGRIDAVPQMARLALGGIDGGSDALRWRALREVLALDAVAGIELLALVAADPEDSLQCTAAALLASLLAARPGLREMAAWRG
jgi:hypothetical protein